MHLVSPCKFASHIEKTDIGYCKQYDIDYGLHDPIRVVLEKIVRHPSQRFPMKIWFNRFVVGRPNPITVPIRAINIDNCVDRMLGANIQVVLAEIELWTYTEVYPPSIELDCTHLTVKESIKLGDIEKMLPDGVFLHKKYIHRLHQAVMKLEQTNLYRGRVAMQKKKEDELEAQKKEILSYKKPKKVKDLSGRKIKNPLKNRE